MRVFTGSLCVLFPIFQELNLWFEYLSIFVWPSTNTSVAIESHTGSDGATFRQVETSLCSSAARTIRNAPCTHKRQHIQRCDWRLNNKWAKKENKKMNESSTFGNNEWTWIFEKLKIFLPSLTGCQRRSPSRSATPNGCAQCARLLILSHTKDWSRFGKQRTQSLDYKTNTNPFPGCQNSIEFCFEANASKEIDARNISSFIRFIYQSINWHGIPVGIISGKKLEKLKKLHNH